MNKSTRTMIAAVRAAVVLIASGVAGGSSWANSRDDNSNTSTVATVATRASSTGHNNADIMFAHGARRS